MKVFIAGVGVVGPGLFSWPDAVEVLSGNRLYDPEPLTLAAPSILAARERRRCSLTVRLALSAAQQASEQSGLAPQSLSAVFGSSNGNGSEIHAILEALRKPGRPVSPTHFHNSVHNSAVGYWCIATGCHEASTSIASHDYTFAAAFMKAAAQASAENRPVLVSVYDDPLPPPLHSKRPIAAPFAVAFVLLPAKDREGQTEVAVRWCAGVPQHDGFDCESEDLRALWRGNPAARSLPLLRHLATQSPGRIAMPFPSGGLLELELA